MAMDSFPMFFTIHAIAFTLIVFLALIWLILVSVEIFTCWSISDSTSQSLMFFLMLTNAVTIFIPPVLLILEFRIWLDATCHLLIFVLQTGAATAFMCWSPQIQYPDETADNMGICKLLNAYTVMAYWIIPVISLLYSIYFAVVLYMQSHIPVTVDSPKIVPSSAKLVVGFRTKHTESFITSCPATTAAYTASTPVHTPSAKPISFHESTMPQIPTSTPH
ncbi:hypothetical protein EDC04DRAFT_3142144 [Pisolithus marmoratus]|nr:hypothetical protein EDC04DRAFT_3142144 [Pisolithus marmoratus]